MAKQLSPGLMPVVAAALVVLLASCSRDDAVAPDETPAPPAAKAVSDQGEPADTSLEIDATMEMADWMACTQRVYDSERESEEYDEKAHARSWEACVAERQVLVELYPLSQRPGIELLLWSIHNSIRSSAMVEPTARPGYGLNPGEPVMVGGLSQERNEGVARTLHYLVRLRGPEGQRVTYKRLGSCCSFRTPNPVYGNRGRLDIYEIAYEGLGDPALVYFNVYDEAPQQVVAGFTMIAG